MAQLFVVGALAGLVLLVAGCAHPTLDPSTPAWSDTPPVPIRSFEDSIAVSVIVEGRAAASPFPGSGNCVHLEGPILLLQGLFRAAWDSPDGQAARLAVVYESQEGAYLAATVTGTSPLQVPLHELPRPSDLTATAKPHQIERVAFVVTTVDRDDVLVADFTLGLEAIYMSATEIPALSPDSVQTCGLPN